MEKEEESKPPVAKESVEGVVGGRNTGAEDGAPNAAMEDRCPMLGIVEDGVSKARENDEVSKAA